MIGNPRNPRRNNGGKGTKILGCHGTISLKGTEEKNVLQQKCSLDPCYRFFFSFLSLFLAYISEGTVLLCLYGAALSPRTLGLTCNLVVKPSDLTAAHCLPGLVGAALELI